MCRKTLWDESDESLLSISSVYSGSRAESFGMDVLRMLYARMLIEIQTVVLQVSCCMMDYNIRVRRLAIF